MTRTVTGMSELPEVTQTRAVAREATGNRRAILAVASIVAAVTVVAGAAFVLRAGQAGIGGQAVATANAAVAPPAVDEASATGGIVRLVPAGAAGPAPFAAAAKGVVPTLSSQAVAAVAAARANWPIDPTVGVALVEGSSEGVYAGDPGQPDCRIDELGTAITAVGAAGRSLVGRARHRPRPDLQLPGDADAGRPWV